MMCMLSFSFSWLNLSDRADAESPKLTTNFKTEAETELLGISLTG